MTALRWPAKRAIDLLGAVAGLIVLGPLLLLINLAMRWALGPPVLMRQLRVGRHGSTLKLFKFRTTTDARRAGGALLPEGHLCTRLGGWLRRTNLDGLPALINVLRGEMSLVGPRPHAIAMDDAFAQVISNFADRHLVRPGLTGLAQIQLPPDTNMASVQRKLACDLYYVGRVGFWLDLKILLGTVSHVMGIPFAVPRMLLQIPSGAAIASSSENRAAEGACASQMQPA